MFDGMKGTSDAMQPAYAGCRAIARVKSNPICSTLAARGRFFFPRRIGISLLRCIAAPRRRSIFIPFDVIPRILAAKESEGVVARAGQRVKAINAYVEDVYRRHHKI